MVYHKILNIVLCARKQGLALYPFYTQKLTSDNPNIPAHPSPNACPFSDHKCLFLFCRYIHLCHILDPMCRWYDVVFVFIFFNCIYLFLAVLSLVVIGGYSSCSSRASHCGGVSCCGAQALGHSGFNNCSSKAPEHRLNSYGARA